MGVTSPRSSDLRSVFTCKPDGKGPKPVSFGDVSARIIAVSFCDLCRLQLPAGNVPDFNTDHRLLCFGPGRKL